MYVNICIYVYIYIYMYNIYMGPQADQPLPETMSLNIDNYYAIDINRYQLIDTD